MSYRRTLEIDLPPGQSAFLWGARQTGKSTYLRERFPDSAYIDLLDFDVVLRLNARPSRLGEELSSMPEALSKPVIVDEIQKVPGLLDEVHRRSEEGRHHGKKLRKFNQGCTICRSCRWRAIGLDRLKIAGMQW